MLGWAAVLAFILHPLQERLTQRLKGRRALSAGILTALTPFLVLAPLSVLTGAFVGQVTRLIEYLRGHSFLSFPEVVERLSGYPLIGGAVGWMRENALVERRAAAGLDDQRPADTAQERRLHGKGALRWARSAPWSASS